jgi:peptide chain release factor
MGERALRTTIAAGATNPFLVRCSMGTRVANTETAAALERRMHALGVREADLEETFVRSGGHGGQNVNKTATCVMLRHRPTGLQVKCQTTRQQGWNRLLAREWLLDKVEAARRERAAAERAQREKERRRKRPRSRGAKERMLADKARRSEKKVLRRGPGDDGVDRH